MRSARLLELLLRHVAQPGGGRGDQAREAEAPELEARRAELSRRPGRGRAFPPLASRSRRNATAEKPAISVPSTSKKAPTAAPAGALVDLAGQVGVERHTKPSWKIPPPGPGVEAPPASRPAPGLARIRAGGNTRDPRAPAVLAPAGGRRVVFLLDASSPLERRLLERWIERARPAGTASAAYDVVAIPPSRRRRRAGRVDPRLEATLAVGDDPLLAPLRVAWLPAEQDGCGPPASLSS